ncbi:MAG: Mur ligase family protein [Saprospiraceae bacterium]
MAKIHLISIGGAVMHNIAIALHNEGNIVTGSDDEIYEPSRTRLEKAGILPEKIGWFPDKITSDLDYVILGMHARQENPELLAAQKMGIKLFSFPEFIYEHSKNKTRIVVGGSQGKTSTTSMIMWVLKKLNFDFDYLVGGIIKGFDLMVRFSDAPIVVIEGDEYLTSPIDRTPKIIHYKANIGVLTGIDWDHMNVFPTEEIYISKFVEYLDSIESGGELIYYDDDDKIKEVISRSENSKNIKLISYDKAIIPDNIILKVFGEHNKANLHAALLVCKSIGIGEEKFWEAISDFEGAEKRLQLLYSDSDTIKFLDFAHAPAKVRATVNAVREEYKTKKLYAFYELHTFSSLNKDFLPQYKDTMNNCDKAVVLFNPHTLEMKKMPSLNKEEIKRDFNREDLIVFDEIVEFEKYIYDLDPQNAVFLFMSSGNFGGIDLINKR